MLGLREVQFGLFSWLFRPFRSCYRREMLTKNHKEHDVHKSRAPISSQFNVHSVRLPSTEPCKIYRARCRDYCTRCRSAQKDLFPWLCSRQGKSFKVLRQRHFISITTRMKAVPRSFRYCMRRWEFSLIVKLVHCDV